jgi:hypothetical protein
MGCLPHPPGTTRGIVLARAAATLKLECMLSDFLNQPQALTPAEPALMRKTSFLGNLRT